MSLGWAALVAAAETHAARLGVFDRVNLHEPKSGPGPALTLSLWFDRVGPAPRSSGFTATTAVVTLAGRIVLHADAEPASGVDARMVNALDAYFAAIAADFTFGGISRNVDLLGQTGVALSAVAGFIDYGDSVYRAYTIAIPVIVDDAWPQAGGS